MSIIRTNLYGILCAGLLSTAALAQDNQGSTDAGEVHEAIRDAVETMTDYTVEQRDEAVDEARKALAVLDEELAYQRAAFKHNWMRFTDSTREQATQWLEQLNRQRNRVAEWYGSMKYASGEAWEEVREGFSRSYAELVDSWENAQQLNREVN
jgi:hypothetical protein